MDRHTVSTETLTGFLTRRHYLHYVTQDTILNWYFHSQSQNTVKNPQGFYTITMQKIASQLNALTQKKKIKQNTYWFNPYLWRSAKGIQTDNTIQKMMVTKKKDQS